MRSVICPILACLAAVAVQAGPFDIFGGDEVKLEHLAQVPPESLVELKDSHFAVLAAEVELERAKLAEQQAGDEVKSARAVLDTEQLDFKAARSEEKAARANKDQDRLAVARLQTEAAERELKVAKALVEWKENVNKARKEEVDRAKQAVDLAQAQRDLERVRLLVREQVPAGNEYRIAEFESRVAKQNKDLDNATRKVERQWTKVERLAEDYRRLADAQQEVTS